MTQNFDILHNFDFSLLFLEYVLTKVLKLCNLLMYQQIWLFWGAIMSIMYSILYVFYIIYPSVWFNELFCFLNCSVEVFSLFQQQNWSSLFIMRVKMSISLRFIGPLEYPILTKLTFYPEFKMTSFVNAPLVTIGYSKGLINLNKINIFTLIMNNEDQFCCWNKLKTSTESF